MAELSEVTYGDAYLRSSGGLCQRRRLFFGERGRGKRPKFIPSFLQATLRNLAQPLTPFCCGKPNPEHI